MSPELPELRLRAIGHLREAEDESQAWPERHDAIREARREFEQANKLPDFTALRQKVAAELAKAQRSVTVSSPGRRTELLTES